MKQLLLIGMVVPTKMKKQRKYHFRFSRGDKMDRLVDEPKRVGLGRVGGSTNVFFFFLLLCFVITNNLGFWSNCIRGFFMHLI